MNRFNYKNLMPKIFSILFALIIWVYVMSEINPRVTRDEQNIPIEFLHAEEMRQMGLVVKGDTDYTVRVRLTGRRDEVYRINRSQIKASVDLLGFRAGVNNIPVEVTVPGDVEIDFHPKFIRVELEEIVSRQKPVDVAIEGTPRKGYILGELQYEPTVVWVEGAESLVNSVEVVQATIKLSEDTQNISTVLPLKPLNSRGEEVHNVKLQTPNVKVNLLVDGLKTVNINPLVEATAASGYEISSLRIEPNTITIRGQQEFINSVDSINTEVITLNNISENITQLVNLQLPEGITLVENTEINLIITVEPLVQKTFKITKENINFKNLAPGLRVDTSEIPEILEIKIVANETVMQTVNPNNLRVVIDMEGLGENQYTVDPVIEVPLILEKRARDIQLFPRSLNIKVISENY